MKQPSKSKITFSFGENWEGYLKHALTDEGLQIARDRTSELLKLDSLSGLTFVDIGCGSGIFSYVAYQMGAGKVISIDVDPKSISCCAYMRGVAGNPEHWEIREGSILDENFVRSIPLADVVYSWGVLHHTGDMWRAIRMAGDLVKPGGRFAIAIYNKLEYSTFKQWRGSHKWFRIKQTYNRSGTVTKRAMELAFASKDIITMLLRVRSPVACVREYREKRGMSWWHDLVDWLGGYPYEFASAGEIFMFCHEQLGMELERLSTTCSIGCHEFLFVRPAERPATPLSCGIPFDRQARLE